MITISEFEQAVWDSERVRIVIRDGSNFRGRHSCGRRGSRRLWIPAFAGMTGWGQRALRSALGASSEYGQS